MLIRPRAVPSPLEILWVPPSVVCRVPVELLAQRFRPTVVVPPTAVPRVVPLIMFGLGPGPGLAVVLSPETVLRRVSSVALILRRAVPPPLSIRRVVPSVLVKVLYEPAAQLVPLSPSVPPIVARRLAPPILIGFGLGLLLAPLRLVTVDLRPASVRVILQVAVPLPLVMVRVVLWVPIRVA